MELRASSPFTWLRLLQIAALLLLGAALASGQSVRWQPDRGALGFGQTTELQLIFEDCSPDGTPSLPAVPGLSMELAGQSQSWETINFSMTRRVILTYMARATQKGTLRIPSFETKTDKGTVRVRQAEFQVGEATVGQSGASLDSIVQSRLNLPDTDVWAGEVFPLSYTLSIARRFSAQLASNVEWSSTPLAAEDWAKPEMADVMVGGENRTVVTYRARAMSKEAGRVPLKQAQQLVNLQTGTSTFGLFARPTMEQFTITSQPVTLNVKPLPVPAPALFSGAVGEFTLSSKVVPVQATVGEPITWTLELAGVGNWPEITALPSRQVSKDFRVVQPQAKRTTKEGMLFEGTLSEDVVLIATKPGTYTLGPVRWSYFDPKAGEYRTLVTDTYTVTIAAAAPPPATSVAPSPVAPGGSATPGTSLNPSAQPPPSPALPRPIPRDPLPGESRGWEPLTGGALLSAAGSSVAALAVFWFGLALQRARKQDPARPRREARDRLLHVLVQSTSGPTPAQLKVTLESFRKESVVLLASTHLTPSAAQIQAQAAKASADGATWSVLWSEAERALFGSDAALPSDWRQRAEAAVRAFSVRPFNPLSSFRLRHLAPFLVWVVVCSWCFTSANAADATATYRSGKFVEAETTWRERVTTAPTDWIARHNLALALGQQDRWGEAAAHATAAYVQQPRDPSVRWHLELSLQRAGFTPGELVPFLSGNPVYRIAPLLSPTHWTLVLVGAAWCFVTAVCLQLYRSFHPGTTLLRTLALLLMTLSIVAGTLGFASLYLYRSLADPRAAVVWQTSVLRSIPTEAVANQKSSPLPAGSIGVIDKDFLGWRRLAFSNGQTGWVHAKDLVPLWRAPVRPPAAAKKK